MMWFSQEIDILCYSKRSYLLEYWTNFFFLLKSHNFKNTLVALVFCLIRNLNFFENFQNFVRVKIFLFKFSTKCTFPIFHNYHMYDNHTVNFKVINFKILEKCLNIRCDLKVYISTVYSYLFIILPN
jgi:hypothetical protein